LGNNNGSIVVIKLVNFQKTKNMKKYSILIALLMVGSFAFSQEAAPATKVDGPVITLEKNNHDFGTIAQGDVVEQVFKFTNTGNQPLIITDVKTSCGCTQPVWPRNPIMPGDKGEIKVGFNSAGKSNKQTKVLPIISNATNDASITFTTNVIVKTPQ
jgi:hypothetical protein